MFSSSVQPQRGKVSLVKMVNVKKKTWRKYEELMLTSVLKQLFRIIRFLLLRAPLFLQTFRKWKRRTIFKTRKLLRAHHVILLLVLCCRNHRSTTLWKVHQSFSLFFSSCSFHSIYMQPSETDGSSTEIALQISFGNWWQTHSPKNTRTETKTYCNFVASNRFPFSCGLFF